MVKRIFIIPAIMLACVACASSPPPNAALASALASMRGAEEIGAARVPRASLQLQLAAEEVDRAKRLMADGKNGRAHNMALRAVQDAELAIALTREEKARSAAEAAEQRVEAVNTPEGKP